MSALIWTVNGFLTLLFFLVDHLAAVGLLISCGYFVLTSPEKQRSWAAGAGILALAASIFAPAPFPVLLLALSLGGWAVLKLEQYAPDERRWDIIRGLGMYGGGGLLYVITKIVPVFDTGDLVQGSNYLTAIVSIAIYLFPVGILAWWAKSIFAHQPGLGKPEDIISKVRTRGRQ